MYRHLRLTALIVLWTFIALPLVSFADHTHAPDQHACAECDSGGTVPDDTDTDTNSNENKRWSFIDDVLTPSLNMLPWNEPWTGLCNWVHQEWNEWSDKWNELNEEGSSSLSQLF